MSLPAEIVRFQATDGVWLEGWKITADASRSWVILCHGLGANRSDLFAIARGLRDAGLNLFLLDFRSHGRSAGQATSFGWQEQRDLEGALTFLGQQPDVPAKPYGVYGISMGASVALMVAARDERIGAVAAESPYPTLQESLERHLALVYPALPKIPFAWFLSSAYRLRFGVWPRAVSPLESASRLSPRPLLLIQGGEAPIDGTRRMFAKAGQPKTLWVVEGTGHLGSFAENSQAFCGRLVKFFESSLGS